MATFTMVDTAIHIGGHDFSTDSNEITFNLEVEDQDVTTFQSGGYRSRVGGLKDVNCDVSGFWQSDTDAVDLHAFNNLGVANRAVTVSPTNTAGETVYMFQGGQFSYELLGSIGEATPFSVSMLGTEGREGAVRGLRAAARQDMSATGQLGSVLNLGAPTSGQFVYAALHVFSVGTTITVTVESDSAADFLSPTIRGTFNAGPVTAQGGYWLSRVAGPFVGETHWRLNVTAVTGTFSVAGAIAIQ